ncbi:hypothetical protein INR79_27805 [Vibrio sp. SCSIO 43132]|uniref:hypothetical protein n=1 Tax=Vibrio sp. SCSIO 43132 TaxID=2779363 RepID=UPI001CA959FF|nr:hypothetical protein [Vibrio sp. SCSIO 43132]UAB73041.1 hypothetical protein INR79_27805 [Vibrio sp. SCSIO 43132]
MLTLIKRLSVFALSGLSFFSFSAEKDIRFPLQCLGTEPFWSLNVNQDSVIFEDLEENREEFSIKNIVQSNNHINRWFITFTSESKPTTKLMALHRTGSCSDDMSDSKYDYEVMILTTGTAAFSGCCNRLD